MFSDNLKNYDNPQSSVHYHLNIYSLSLAIFMALLVMFPTQAAASDLNLKLSNALSGQALPNTEVLAYQQQADQSWKPFKRLTTNAQGMISFDLPGLGKDTQYKFRTKPYTTGYAYSQSVSQTGTFEFKVGHLEAKIIAGTTGKVLPNHKIRAFELLADGKTKWVATGMSEANGFIRFDIPEMGSGKKFVLAALSPGDGLNKHSETITRNGKITFTVGNKLLNFKLSNALSGQALPNTEVLAYQQQADQSWKPFKRLTTNAQGMISFDLPGLGKDTQYKFRTKPYTTGYAYSQSVSQTGTFEFKVGHLEAKIIAGATGKVLPNHKIRAFELLADGKTKWVATGMSEANGLIRFDIPEMGSGKKFVLAALSPGDGLNKHSETITRNGKITFTVGNKLLNFKLSNALSGQALPNTEVLAYQQQADQSWKPFKRLTTNAQGMISFDLPGLGKDTQYKFRTKPYTTGYAYSQSVSQTGTFDFKVGHLEAKIIAGATGKVLPNHKIRAFELLADGKTKWVATGMSEANGLIRFDIPEMGSGKKFVLAALSPGDGLNKHSETITKNGKLTFTVGNKLLNFKLSNALSGQALPNTEVLAYQQQADQSWKPFKRLTTNAQGMISFDLPGLGKDTQYKFRTKPYTTGYAYSQSVSQTGTFDFKVGHLEAKIIAGTTGKVLPNHKIRAFELLDDGKTKWVATGMSEANGIIRFDIPEMGSGKKFVLAAISPGDGQTKYSETITKNGKLTFTVGNKLLNFKLSNALSGQALPNTEVLAYQQQADQSWKPFKKQTTNAQGTISFDLPGLGKDTQYKFRAKPYTTGYAYSQSVSQTGTFDFKVGKIQVRLSDAINGKLFGNHKLYLYGKTPDGKLHWHRSGKTTEQGIANFDPSSLNEGKVYVVIAKNLYGKDKTFYSRWITTSGIVDFAVSPENNSPADLKPPVVTFLSPAKNSSVSDAGFLVKASVEEGNTISTVKVTVIDPVKGESTSNAQLVKGQWIYSVNAQQLTANQDVVVKILAYDDSQNMGTSSQQFHVIKDIEKPTLSIDSHQNQDQVSENGFLLAGKVLDNTNIKELLASVTDPLLGRIVENSPLQISNNGRWALPVRQTSRGKEVSITLTATDFAGNKAIRQLSLNVTAEAFKAIQLINRITFGSTPELLREIKLVGTDSFIQQQLNPTSIDNSEFETRLNEMGEPETRAALQRYQLAHAIYSKKQLQEVMTWFWENHFNTDVNKVGTQLELDKNKKIRGHALGNFRNLLQITATSPAMMVYLDNKLSRKEEPNENYARELLELHTLGVDGGYTSQDIQEIARVFTGWTASSNGFYFRSSVHDSGEKQILGQAIPASLGKEEGEIVLDILSTHPSTAHFICTKLLQVFVSDFPNNESIENCSTEFLDNTNQDNQIAIVLDGIFRSEYFSTNKSFHNKIKTPLEFLTGFSRNLAVKTSLSSSMRALRAMGMNLFQYPLPTGFPETGIDWINSNRYLQYFQFISTSVFNKPHSSLNYLEEPADYFKNLGYETPEGIVGFLFYLALSNDYSNLEWDIAVGTLTDNDTIIFDINAEDANERIRNLLATALNFPTYQLQ